MSDTLFCVCLTTQFNKILNNPSAHNFACTTQISTAPFRRETQEERSAWVRQQEDAIPTYFGLCKVIFDEFYELLLFWFGIEDIPTVETKVRGYCYHYYL